MGLRVLESFKTCQIFVAFVTEVVNDTFKVLRRARTRCSLSLSRGSLALWMKQRRSSCLLHGLGSPKAVTLACSRARQSCSSPSSGSGSRHSDTRRSRPSDTLLSLLSTLSSRRSNETNAESQTDHVQLTEKKLANKVACRPTLLRDILVFSGAFFKLTEMFLSHIQIWIPLY